MVNQRTMRQFGRKAAFTVLAASVAFALQAAAAVPVFAETVQEQAEIDGAGTAAVTTDSAGDAYVKVNISEPGDYTFTSVPSAEVNGDTLGYLYDSQHRELAVSDDSHADTNFCISRNLGAGTYYLKVQGKNTPGNAAMAVDVAKGQALGVLDCKFEFDVDDELEKFELGTTSHGSGTAWNPADPQAYRISGYVPRDVFMHAQEHAAVDKLAWAEGNLRGTGRFVVRVDAVEGGAYTGRAYYFVENVDPMALAELDPSTSYSVCGAVEKVELGKYTIIPTNWQIRWSAISASQYGDAGYCTRSDFEELGADESKIVWTPGTPHETGEYVVKLAASADSPYSGIFYVWTEVGETTHAGSGKWIIDEPATYSEAGKRHLRCAYCGAACDETVIPALEGSTDTAGSGATLADYKITGKGTAAYVRCRSGKATATIPAKVKIGGSAYKVTAITAKAFRGSKATTVAVKSTALAKKSVKNCLSGSKVKTAKVPKAKKAAYAKLFAKSNSGKKVTVK